MHTTHPTPTVMLHAMTAEQTPDKPHATPTQRRISNKVRVALNHRVKEGSTWIEAAKAAGLSEAGIHKARKQPHVQAELEKIKTSYILEVEGLRSVHKTRAFEVARELLDNSKSDAVRARMVEFLAGDPKNKGVNVAVQVNNAPAGGYEYAPKGAQIVEIRQTSDCQSPDTNTQATDK